MKLLLVSVCGLIMAGSVVSAENTSLSTNNQSLWTDSYTVAQNTNPNKNPNKNPNRKNKENGGMNVGVSNNGVSVGAHKNGTSVRVGPSGPRVSTRTDSGVRLSVSGSGRIGIGF